MEGSNIYERLLFSNEQAHELSNGCAFRIRVGDVSSHPSRTQFRFMSNRIVGTSQWVTYGSWPGLHIDYLAKPIKRSWTSIMRVNSQIHRECCETLYGRHVFEFGDQIECIVPFLQDLTDVGRASLKRISITKRLLTSQKDFDKCEWQTACDYIARNLSLDHLYLVIRGVRARSKGQSGSRDSSSSDNSRLSTELFMKDEKFEWARQLSTAKVLKELHVSAELDEMYLPKSEFMDFYAAFSNVIETDFAGHLKGIMLCD
ncbi:MAG: hypothetical protein OHK93_004822 [Ramalina farinacea]|uniref:Uncharacterized protein n=1 Tax=Ramalina farinacea TaxID=258253 RepID=A0AA43TYU1_9LECA|nr:hypothetical protein [Ramalina farinacea]